MSKDNLHEPAMRKIQAINTTALSDMLRELAKLAKDSEAANAEAKLSYLGNEEIVSALYVPEIVLRVTEVV